MNELVTAGQIPLRLGCGWSMIYPQTFITYRVLECQAIPNVQLQAAAGYDLETRNAVAFGVQVGVKLPLWNRNQGTIREVQADLARAHAEVTRVELSLRERLADAFNRYQTARETAQVHRDTILPRTREAYEVQREIYQQRRTRWHKVVRLRRGALDVEARYTRALLIARHVCRAKPVAVIERKGPEDCIGTAAGSAERRRPSGTK